MTPSTPSTSQAPSATASASLPGPASPRAAATPSAATSSRATASARAADPSPRTTGSDALQRPAGSGTVVVGGGILGTSLAVALAARGREVTLVDAGANPASRRSFAWLNAASASTPDYVALRTAGLLHHLVHARTLGPRSPYRFEGSLSFDGVDGSAAAPAQGEEDRVTTLRAKLTLLRAAGLPAQGIGRDRARELEPGVQWNGAAEPVLHAPLEGSVDLGQLLDLQRERLTDLGGSIVEGTARLRTTSGGRSARVLVDGAELDAAAVVVAAGAATQGVLDDIGLSVPERTSTGAVLTVPGAGTTVRTVLRGPDVSLRPTTGGDLLVHSNRLDRLLGDGGPAGSAASPGTPVHPDDLEGAPQEAVAAALATAGRFLGVGIDPGTARLDVGPRPVPADGLPVVGPVGSGIHLLFSHSGATLSLVLADLLASEIVDGVVPDILRSFRPSRFGLVV
jgi:glycine/D-amino acid oxidase-like deaminating enzyme